MIGLITGLNLIENSLVSDWELREEQNEYGKVYYYGKKDYLCVLRHGIKNNYKLPDEVNHKANIKFLSDKGVSEVVGINSTGSMRKNITPGSIIIPHDFIMLYPSPTIRPTQPKHVTPVIDEKIRKKLIKIARSITPKINIFPNGVYWQTPGPRLETKAEIKMMSKFAHIVGMTMASEAVIATEFKIPYASLCSVDNYAHGIADTEISEEMITQQAKENAEKISMIISKYLSKG